MPPARRPEFEPSFGTRATDATLPDRLRDPERGDAAAHPTGGGHDAPLTGEPTPGRPVVEFVDDSPAGDASGGEAERDEELATEPTLPPPTAHTSTSADALPVSAPAPATGESLPAGPASHPTDEAGTDGSEPVSRERVGNRWFRVRKRIVAVLAIVIVVALGYYLISLFQVWTTGRADADGPVDAIVVMGAAQYDGRPSPQLEARLDHVLVRWEDGVAPLVVATGGNLPGDRFTEAEASATYLIERGIPEEAILLENAGSTTYESLESVAALLAARGLDEVLIVTDPYHALRSRLIAEEVGLDASVSSTDTSVVTGGDSLRRHLQEAGGVAVGRVIGFERLTSIVD